MLLPSALPCTEEQQQSSQRTAEPVRCALFASPPLSPLSSTRNPRANISNIYSTCRALQSMLSHSPQPLRLPSPPMVHTEPPWKHQLRACKLVHEDRDSLTSQKRIIERTASTPTLMPLASYKSKTVATAAADDDASRDTVNVDMDLDLEHVQDKDHGTNNDHENHERSATQSTPKRIRVAPEILPLGLERSDFQSLQGVITITTSSDLTSTSQLHPEFPSPNEWSTEEDSMLVELVLEKLQLTKSDWQECARSLGRSRGSVGKRWKSLMMKGDVGLRQRRGVIHGTWRRG